MTDFQSDNIFRDHAQAYWNVGLPVIPLKKWDSPAKGAGKAPILNEWTAYAHEMPTPSMQKLWLNQHPDSNIGLPFGPASGLCAIDIDTVDEELIATIMKALPDSPWRRVGQKGCGLIYRWQGQANFKLRDNENQTIVEFLGMGNQMVLPPSVHPKTERPYVANVNLWEVLGDIPQMPVDIQQILREALEPVLGEKGFSLAKTSRSSPLEVVPEGERDIQMVRHAGYLARIVLGIDKSKKFTLKDAMEHMHTWVVDYTSQVAGDDMDPGKGVAKLLEFLLKDIEAGRTMPNGWDQDLTDKQREDPTIAMLIEKNQVQRWTYSKARASLEEKVGAKAEDPDWALECINSTFEEIARDDNFSDLEAGTLMNFIKDRYGKDLGLAKPDLKNLLKEKRQIAAGMSEMAEDHEAIAWQIIEQLSRGGDLKFAHGRFWRWTGSCYGPMDTSQVFNAVCSGVKGNVLSRRHGDYVAIQKTMMMLVTAPLAEEMEIGINFANGFLDSEFVLHDHSPKYGKTFTMPFNYVPERASEAHKWLEFLESCWGDDEDYVEKVAALQEAFAATMFGIATSYQRAILLYGKAGSGKSVILKLIESMMPASAIASVSPVVWNQTFALVSLVGRTLNICGELPEDSSIDGARFKQVIEGAPCTDSFKGQDNFSFRPTAAHWFGSNHLPRTRDTSAGFVRRWLILEFNHAVPQDKRIVDYEDILLEEEREAIAAWAVQGLPRLLRKGNYTIPKSCENRLGQVSRSNNSVAAWLDTSEKVRPMEGETADARECFDQYLFHMREVSRGFGVSYERFLQMAEDLGHDLIPYDSDDGFKRIMLSGMRIRLFGEV